MELKVIRQIFTDKSTIGKLFIDGEFECFVLEDVVRDHKIKHETAIPYGRYEVVITFSDRFKKPLPLLLSVPEFSGIRIHSGNDRSATSGCLLLGCTRGVDFVGESRSAMEAFMPKLREGLEKGKVFITIERGE
jgi:hypothetical protein